MSFIPGYLGLLAALGAAGLLVASEAADPVLGLCEGLTVQAGVNTGVYRRFVEIGVLEHGASVPAPQDVDVRSFKVLPHEPARQ